jgi:AhpD family alkylhydroperoxidase
VTKRLDHIRIAPGGVKAFGSVYGYVLQCGLPAELVALVYLRVSQINNCAYWLEIHTRDLLRTGVSLEKIARVDKWQEGDNLFSASECAALAWAETVTRLAETGVSDEAYDAARAVFGEKDLVDLTVAISLMNAYDRMAISFAQASIGK